MSPRTSPSVATRGALGLSYVPRVLVAVPFKFAISVVRPRRASRPLTALAMQAQGITLPWCRLISAYNVAQCVCALVLCSRC